MSTKTLDEITTNLAVAIRASSMAKPYKPEDNPLAGRNLDDMVAGAGILKHSDLYPQEDKYGWMGDESLNATVVEGLERRKVRRKDQRQRTSRARAQRKQQIDAIVDAPVAVDESRMTLAWAIMRPLVPAVTRIASSKAMWARRYLGEVQDDVSQTAMCRMATYLAKSSLDLDTYQIAAAQLGDDAARIPGNQEDKDLNKQRKREAKARKSLMSLCNHMVMTTLADIYRDAENLRWENLDIIETVMTNINGAGDDPAMAQFLASKAPHFIASRMWTPGSLHPDVLRIAIAAAITERGLDRLTELLISDENVRTDGSFTWTARAEDVFMSVKDGAAKWGAVVQATEHHKNPDHSRALAARMFARNQFEFLPWLIGAVLEACEPTRVAWTSKGNRAIIASAFDPDLIIDGERVRPGCLIPMVGFTDVREASEVLAETLASVLAEYV